MTLLFFTLFFSSTVINLAIRYKVNHWHSYEDQLPDSKSITFSHIGKNIFYTNKFDRERLLSAAIEMRSWFRLNGTILISIYKSYVCKVGYPLFLFCCTVALWSCKITSKTTLQPLFISAFFWNSVKGIGPSSYFQFFFSTVLFIFWILFFTGKQYSPKIYVFCKDKENIWKRSFLFLINKTTDLHDTETFVKIVSKPLLL